MSNNLQDWIGTELQDGRYRVVDKLGEGGMGTVYRAHDTKHSRDVVIKIPRPSLLEDKTFTRRFKRELKSLSELTHPNIVKIQAMGNHQGIPFGVMQYLAGGDLEDQRLIDKAGLVLPYDPSRLAPWLGPVCEALDFIHQKGYVHRDIKPSNILFDPTGQPYISDFGVVKAITEANGETPPESLTDTDHVIGTVAYLAPEMLSPDEISGQADQYSLAITIYELLAGQLPFPESTSPVESLEHLTQSVPPLRDINATISPELATALHTALQRDPHQRYPSCSAFGKALLATVAGGENISSAVRSEVHAAPAMARLNCPACHVQLRISEKFAGQTTRCPQCHTTLIVARDLGSLKLSKTASDDTQLVSRKKTAAIPKPSATSPADPDSSTTPSGKESSSVQKAPSA
ncbi:MAG: serine/threonine protein kinase, partial [Planctomycetaceae bacterium]|nr:serine/threonine protein kinase [Planctomycetaceae bacterium]